MAKNSVADLLSVDSLFTTQAEREESKRETVQDIPLSEISEFPNHPFKVRMDESMMEMVESVKQYGVLVPALIRPKANGGYEMVAGHRRMKASELAGRESISCIVRELTDDEATLIMVDSNLQREQILPSEKAFAYKMKLDAMKRQGQRTDLTCEPLAHKFAGKKSRDILAEQVGESKDQIRRFIRLTNLLFMFPDQPKIWVKYEKLIQEGNNMNECKLTETQIEFFHQYLIREEKSTATVEKYLRDVRAFCAFLCERDLTKDAVMAYKKCLQERNYAIRSINSMLASINCFLIYIGKPECRVKFLKLQKQVYCTEEKELSKAEYERLLKAAERNEQLWLVMQAICATGIRVSELQFFTVEAISHGEVVVSCKAKTRTILIPSKLRKRLLDYARKQKIRSGVIFLTQNGKTMDRKTIWAQMKGLCKAAGVNPTKVFPHNLRKLFARTFYGIEKDIAKLADILGHSSIDTTRIYIITTGTEHRKKIERLGLVV